ncbi:MAG: shikimate kinase [Desulfuromonadaceae bacterium]|nr:shikimate kinase [Desulfuromonadaceae bacterium]
MNKRVAGPPPERNITLIGMPGAGKSTVGVVLAKKLSLTFVDTDILIQARQGRSLQQILESDGYKELRQLEEQEILRLQVEHSVIATGGSAVYSARAMEHLQRISTIVYLDLPYADICRRIHDFATRGIACAPEQSFEELYIERGRLYRTYAEVTICEPNATQDEVADLIISQLHKTHMGTYMGEEGEGNQFSAP